jgi:hypothetical protein
MSDVNLGISVLSCSWSKFLERPPTHIFNSSVFSCYDLSIFSSSRSKLSKNPVKLRFQENTKQDSLAAFCLN